MNAMKKLVLGALLVALPHFATAHPGGHHGNEEPLSKVEVGDKAGHVFRSLVQGNKLAASWQGKEPSSIAARPTPAGGIWVVTYENPAEADQAKRKLYLFLDEFGNYIGGNHTGTLQ